MSNLAVEGNQQAASDSTGNTQAASDSTGNTQAAASDANNPEEESKQAAGGSIYRSMGMVANKNTVQNLESRKETWNSLSVPESIEAGLAKLHYFKPSII